LGAPQEGAEIEDLIEKVHLVAHQHIPPRDLNAVCVVSSLCPSADLDAGATSSLLVLKAGDQASRFRLWRPSLRVSRLACCRGGAW
jgi:hypothetical protein